ncbi:MAG: dihydrofolate reductase [Bacteroidales bacterium]|nr:dihydrofolate reductase [Bacteroidales bacterium]
MPYIVIIVAIDKNNGIGYQNELLFRLPNDMKHFKTLTTGHTVLMGRKTFESLPKGALPNRRNIILSSNPTLKYTDAEVYSSMDEALKTCAENEKVYIIGGHSVYKKAIDLADELRLTFVDAAAENVDVFFPVIDFKQWEKVDCKGYPIDDKHKQAYSFATYLRKKI